jgi:hypothetical protein
VIHCEDCKKHITSTDPMWQPPELCKACGAERDKLRAENERLRKLLEQVRIASYAIYAEVDAVVSGQSESADE